MKERTMIPVQLFLKRGQATVEIMIILPLLLIILSISLSIFAQQMIISDSIRSQQSVERSAEILANGIIEMSRAPIGSKMQLFIPAGTETQTIQLRNGLVEAQSARGYASSRIPYLEWSTPPLYDGNFFTIQKDANGSLVVQAVQP